MTKLWGTVAFRLALGYVVLAIGSMSVISAAFYFGTVGVLARSTDGKLVSISQRLARHFETRGSEGLRQEVQQLLVDGIEQDTEAYLLVPPDERKIVGNIFGWTEATAPLDRLTDLAVMRNGRPSTAGCCRGLCRTARFSWSAVTCKTSGRSSSSCGAPF